MSEATVETRRVFLLGRESWPGRDGWDVRWWGRAEDGPVMLRLPPQEAVFFVPRGVATEAGRRRPVELRTLRGEPVDAVYFTDRRTWKREARRLRDAGTPAWEDDVKPADRYLMERFVTAGARVRGRAHRDHGVLIFDAPHVEPAEVAPALRVASFDVESEGLEGPLISVAVVEGEKEHVFVRDEGGAGARRLALRPPPKAEVALYPDERSTLAAFLAWVRLSDPDVLIGWNCIDFDLAYLEARCRAHGLPFRLGRAGGVATVLGGGDRQAASVARVPGRVVLDGIATLRAATWSFERWGLEHVGQALLGRGKALEPTGDALAEILRLYREDLPALVEYNLEDCRLVRDIFAEAQLLEFAVERQRLTGLTLDRRAGAVAAFDHLYLPRLHRAGRVAASVGTNPEPIRSPGGYVLDSQPGLYENVLVLDFKSLYPSLIRTFRVDPLGLAEGLEAGAGVEGFGQALFDRETHILPALIEELWAARDAAKKKGDAALSRAIKILMNSFYGVLGTPVSRFYDPRLASSITLRGHEVLQRSRGWIEAKGWRVIYGDTDSLFVLLGPEHGGAAAKAIGAELAAGLNGWWAETVRAEHGVESRLEVEFETHYARFLMPTMRGSTTGSKKRYAGTIEGAGAGVGEGTRLVFKGLEAVRTDWTPLARRFQRELFRRVFAGEPYAEWVRRLSGQLFEGELDGELVYRKRLRRDLGSYAEQGAPPHVVAARQLERPGREVEYVITTHGPQPIGRVSAPIDYAHYMQKQLAPAGDTILHFLGESVEHLGGRQLSLF
ncbi:MAG TPA: DNA polymerase II [Polyangiaceae bacterium LLY-WYZ-15_(1-7)]|nr:DNA polymerase II [Myxococcales bacterium]MAT29645.1 DNA polymerase II [Sandaracinus sp.]MBJ71398.1 DNA polymerase II [Sandaracinus sp.]HJL06464.1 DNA polymerase II [Polyangiaceae bacterium LLY-WYZ-15_(1-7)]HJL12334.1 DNA polymerase II [Polyangiaceae bacterium LLY-WYZ-15_(1-7)]